MKTCKICSESKPITEYYKGRITTAGNQMYQPYCKPCMKNVSKQWQRDNYDRAKAIVDKCVQNKRKLGYHVVYLLPKHNYVGVTDSIRDRMYSHKSNHKRDTSDYKILHKFNNREKALAKEREYHAMGYDG